MANGQQKNLAVGVILTIFFGGLGMFYTSVKWGIIGIIGEAIAWATIIVFIGVILIPLWHIVCIIITVLSINKQNGR
ncbi:MAG: hypothetical protein LBQ57_05955 [Spirochaetales bacterium]|jgi:hypothetical protein|nr:hypothetical protein [Spirochaetales bacterium]